MKQDLVAKYPKDISDFLRINGHLPENFNIEEGFVCGIKGQRYFIHTRAVLPLKAYDNGVGFGLWVEVDREDFFRYTDSINDDDKYMSFTCVGRLANEWPGFVEMKNVEVIVKTISKDEKVYITEVKEIKDPLFAVAISTNESDEEKIKQIEELVVAYSKDPAYNQPWW